jgi:hypothetical protein
MTATPTAPRLLLTLPDVAALARVQRPVVSMWRTRSAGTGSPFPEPRLSAGTQEHFDANEVVAWLDATGRGKNPHPREELALFAAFDDRPGAERRTTLDGLAALLTLKAVTGEQLAHRTGVDLLDLADDADPHDRYLYREIAALGEDMTAVAERADRMSDAAWTPAAAFEHLLAQRSRLGLTDPSGLGLTQPAVDLVARLAVGLAGAEQPDAVHAATFVDPTRGSDLLVAVRGALGDEDQPVAAIVLDDSPGSRPAHRRLVTHGWYVRDVAVDTDGQLTLPASSVVVAHLRAAGPREPSDDTDLATLDEIALAMADDARAVIIGTASALTDPLRAPATVAIRSSLLRTGRVRAIVRLPAGFLPTKPRQQLALWVLGPAHPGIAIGERWTTIADLSATTLDASTIGDVLTDVVASMGDRASVHSHAFRFMHPITTSALLARKGDLVGTPRPRPERSRRDSSEVALQVHDLLAAVNAPARPAVALSFENRTPGPSQRITLGELVASKAARVVPGHRIESGDLSADGTVRVIGSDELTGVRAFGDRTIDRLEFSARYPAARYTEPGDIVFCSTPGIGAVVDTAGLSVVQAPARILRLDRTKAPDLLPDVIARDIRAVHAPGGWRTWAVRLVPPRQRAALESTLTRLAVERAATARRLAALDDLAATLTDGVTARALTLNSLPTPDDELQKKEG